MYVYHPEHPRMLPVLFALDLGVAPDSLLQILTLEYTIVLRD